MWLCPERGQMSRWLLHRVPSISYGFQLDSRIEPGPETCLLQGFCAESEDDRRMFWWDALERFGCVLGCFACTFWTQPSTYKRSNSSKWEVVAEL